MPYDSGLDESLYSKQFETETDRITVSVFSYNKGAKKLQISREKNGGQGDYKFSKLGRMSKEELENTLPLLQEAVKHMD